MACCFVCYLWLSLRGTVVKCKSMRTAGAMKFALEFSEAAREGLGGLTVTDISESDLEKELKDMHIGYQAENSPGQQSQTGLRYRLISTLERGKLFMDQVDIEVDKAEATARGWVNTKMRRPRPTEEEVYKDLNWRIYQR